MLSNITFLMIFCGFWSVAVNAVDKLQFLILISCRTDWNSSVIINSILATDSIYLREGYCVAESKSVWNGRESNSRPFVSRANALTTTPPGHYNWLRRMQYIPVLQVFDASPVIMYLYWVAVTCIHLYRCSTRTVTRRSVRSASSGQASCRSISPTPTTSASTVRSPYIIIFIFLNPR